jgi:hypothetical protein
MAATVDSAQADRRDRGSATVDELAGHEANPIFERYKVNGPDPIFERRTHRGCRTT